MFDFWTETAAAESQRQREEAARQQLQYQLNQLHRRTMEAEKDASRDYTTSIRPEVHKEREALIIEGKFRRVE